MRETDLYAPVKRYLEVQGYAVKGEIRECDIVALRGDEPPVVVELKTTFSLQLMLQGIDRQAMTDAVYLACPAPKRRQQGDILKLCRRLGLGVLFVTGDHVEAVVDPAAYQPRKMPKRTALLLKEFAHRMGDTTPGGSSSRGPRMTAYRQDALRCAVRIQQSTTAKVSVIRTEMGVARAAAILQNDVYGWFQRMDRGVYGLSPKGEAALVIFAGVVASIQPIKV
ncbi:MAG: DUF2161 domain-containing phosphodiesterase [Beijerinckiaceae bacterium]